MVSPSYRWLAWALGILLLLAGLGALVWYYLKGKVREESRSYKIERIVLSIFLFEKGQWIGGGTAYLNKPLPAGDWIDIKASKATLLLENKLQIPLDLKPGKDLNTIDLKSHVAVEKYIRFIRTMQQKDSLTLVLEADIPLTLPGGVEYTLEVRKKRFRLPTFRLPKVKIGKLKFDRLGLKRSKAHLPVYFDNREKIQAHVSGARLKVSIGGVGELQIHQNRPLHLAAHTRDSIDLAGILELEKPLRTAVRILQNKDKYTAHITGQVDVRLVTAKGTEIVIPYRIQEDEGVELVPSKEKIKDLKQMRFDKH